MSRILVSRWAVAICALVACGVLAPTAPAQQAPRHAVSVKPSVGYPGTWFSVTFQAPDSTGNANGMWRYYYVSASGPSGSGGCASQASEYVPNAQAGARVRVRLTPGRDGWCQGGFRGSVTELERPDCPQRAACPDYVIVVRTVGRFSFQVDAQPPGGDHTPPVFAGLQSATTCTPGPQRPGETTHYHLAWKPAHDAVTPRSQIVYDVFKANTPGGENFSSPTWTTAPGAKTFTTPPLPAGKGVYFVVRARDQAGNEDQNRVERAGVNPCV